MCLGLNPAIRWLRAASPECRATGRRCRLSSRRLAQVWDLRSGALQRKLADAHWRSVQSVSFTPDGRRLASAGGDCEVLFWDLEAGEVTSVLEPHRSYGGSVAISPDGKWLAFGGYDFSVRIWDAEMGQQILLLKGHDGQVREIKAHNAPALTTLRSPGHSQHTALMQTSPPILQGGCRCQRYGAADSSCTVGGHRGAVFSVAFSPDGRTLVSGSLDGTCKAWDVVSGELLRTLDMWPSFYFVVRPGPPPRHANQTGCCPQVTVTRGPGCGAGLASGRELPRLCHGASRTPRKALAGPSPAATRGRRPAPCRRATPPHG
jgi:WD40 repeat protein